MIEIKHRYTGAVLFSAQVESLREAVESAVKVGASLAGAYLARADLVGANLVDANLAHANLDDADLAGANMAGANLVDANMAEAYLARADLVGANMARANLAHANLDDADLVGANLAGATGVDDWAKTIRDDIRAVLDAAPSEVPGLLDALWHGRVDGSTYSGECACLVGTLAKVRGVAYDAIPEIRPDSSRPAERWFLQIRRGDTPVTNPSAAFAAAVITQWQFERERAGR